MFAWCAVRIAAIVLILFAPVLFFAASAQERPTRTSYMFEHADADRDGTLSPAEFAMVSAAAGGRGGFPAADADGNGSVSRPELEAWLSASD